jgi:hypothetical protein
VSILDYLGEREGQSFELRELEVELENGAVVYAVTPVNIRNNTYIGDVSFGTRAQQVRQAGAEMGNASTTLRIFIANYRTWESMMNT